MIEPVEWLRTFILLHLSLEYLIIFFAAAFGAEPALLTLGFLAAQGVFPIYPVMLLSFLGTFLSDGFWFLLGRTATMRKIISSRLADKTISVISRAIKRISRGNNVIILIIIKFVVGTRVLVIMSLSSTDMKLREFMRSNVAAVLLWVLVVIPTGYLSGLGFTYMAGILENIYAGIGFILLVAILLVILEIWIKRVFIRVRD